MRLKQHHALTTIVAVPLAASLLVACGSKEEEAPRETSSVTTTKTSTSTAAPSSEAPSSESSEPAPETPSVNQTANPRPVDPDPNPQVPEVGAPPMAEFGPVEGGTPASEADQRAIEALVRGQDEQVGFRDYLGYIPNHTCQRVKAESDPSAYDFSNLPNSPIRENPEFAAGNPHTESVSDVMVNGDEASATVVAVSKGEKNTRTMRFHRENGAWTFCN